MAAKRKKEIGGAPPIAPWMATFSDLMNLLLCFFVLLFSMSTVDEEKWKEVVESFQASFSVFDGGATAVGEGKLISSGISQLTNLGDFFDNLAIESGQSIEDIDSLEKYKEALKQEMIEASEEIAEQIENMIEEKGLEEQIDMDITAQFVQLTLNGAILFDPAKATIRSDALIIVDKVGDILKVYDEHLIQIVGHTDSIPQVSDGKYDDNNELSQGRSYSVMKYLVENKNLDPATIECSGRGEYQPIASNETPEGRSVNRRVEIKIYNQVDIE